jgi:hypothetical protein
MNTGRLMASDQRTPQAASSLEDAPRLLRGDQPISVLIVEDDVLVSRVLSDAVEDYGGRVIGIADIPADAFGLVLEHKPDVVVVGGEILTGPGCSIEERL